MCNSCEYKNICKYKDSVDLYKKDSEQFIKDHALQNLQKIELTCKFFKEEEF